MGGEGQHAEAGTRRRAHDWAEGVALLERLPEAVRLTLARGMSTRRLDYDALKIKIKLMANAHMDNCTPKPMDVGELHVEYEDYDSEKEGCGEHVHVVAKGKGRGPMFGSCWTCGGAHCQHGCPKGGGKGGKGAKGKSKGEPAGKGKGTGRAERPCSAHVGSVVEPTPGEVLAGGGRRPERR